MRGTIGTATLAALFALLPALAQDVTRPAEVADVVGARIAGDVQLGWSAVTADVAGNPEAIDQYKVYRGTSPDFVPDKVSGSNLIGTALDAEYTDAGAAADANTYFYLISAVDADGNESDTKPSTVDTAPTLSGFWTSQTIELDWTGAGPANQIAAYRVYYGRGSGLYEFVDDIPLNTMSHTLAGLQKNVNWYAAVTAVDPNGNESLLSNEHIDAVNGTVRFFAHQGDELCWGAADCTPSDPAKIQRADGFQLLVPVHFPEGEWVSATVTLTLESRLCTPPNQGTTSRCGPGNPCVSPPCNGGYNPCGDPWDRIAKLFVVVDDCVETGGNCLTQNNLELIRAMTPFGTDANPPDGTGIVPPRKLSMDITPLVPLLTGDTHVGVDIVHFVQKGWWVTVDFTFSENPAQASPEPPADGIVIVGYGDAPLPTRMVTIPPTATQVKARLFTSGHGGSLFCNGGTNDAQPCTVNGSTAECPGGGVCSPCDEFCRRNNRILVDGSPVWEVEPWRSDCSPGPACSAWNSCGTASCAFSRAGWCPGYVACHTSAPCDNDIDLTAELPAGGTYAIDYDVVPRNGSWPVSLVVYWYE